MLSGFEKIAPFLSHPLVLIGFIILLLFAIFRSLLRTEIIPKLSRSAASEIVKTLLNYGLIIALSIIFLGFLMEGYKTYLQSRNARINPDESNENKNDKNLKTTNADSTPPATKKTTDNRTVDHSGKEQKIARNGYEVILVLPSDMRDAEILVDGKPATIVDRKLTMVTIRVALTETAHRITARQGDYSCSKEFVVRQNKLRVPLCQ